MLIKVHGLARTDILPLDEKVSFLPTLHKAGQGGGQERTNKETRLLHVNNPQSVNAKQRSLPDCNKFCNDTAKYLPAVVLLAQAVGTSSKVSLCLSVSHSVLAALHCLLGSMTEAAADSKRVQKPDAENEISEGRSFGQVAFKGGPWIGSKCTGWRDSQSKRPGLAEGCG